MNPPKLPLRFFRWFCHPNLRDHIEGDLMELYEERVMEFGKRKADRKFVIDVLLLFRKGIIKPTEGYKNLNTYGMYKSYFKIGWRNLVRNKGYSFINIGGLAIGMTVAILNGLWIWHEFSYNKYFANYDRIAQICETGLDTESGGSWLNTTMTYPLGTELIDKYSQQFKKITRTSFQNERILAVGDMKITSRGLYADDNAPQLFSFKMIEGTRTGLSQTHSILISESLSKILFDTEDPLNRVIRMNNATDLTVTGVFEDFPQNTDFNGVRFVVPWSLFLIDNKLIQERALNDWRNHFIKIYAEILEGQSFGGVTSRIKNALQFDPEDRDMAVKREQQLYLYPMRDWHLNPPWMQQGPRQRQGQLNPILMLKLVGAIGVFVLALACINFVNLSTARAEKRAKEVGIRKTIGSISTQLMTQFFSESLIMVLLSFVFALVLTVLVLPGFNSLASKNIAMPWTNIWFWATCFGFILSTTVLAGGYPALYLSSFNPVKALKGAFRIGRTASPPRKVLVVFQFCITFILLVGTVVVYKQIQFAKSRPVGYDRDGLIMLRKRSNDFSGKYEVLRSELKNTGVVYEVSESMGPATEIYSGNNGWEWKGMDPKLDENFATLSVSHLHGKTVGWKILNGRDFDINNPTDSSGIVINESALKVMKLQDPIGEFITWRWWADKSRVLNYKILGIVEDMVMESPYAPAEPTIFYLKGHNGNPSWINIRINAAFAASEALPKIGDVFKKVVPAVPFDYIFADEEYNKKFGREERIGNIASVFATLAILISCLGLLGLASFVAETRTKEIGIRKVLGATVIELWRMLSKDFIGLVLIACVLATPLAYMLMNKWLSNFSYRINISIWIFVGIALGAIIVTMLTISYQAIKTAMMNPVTSLKTE
jgi:putative ABC transport system permease protein